MLLRLIVNSTSINKYNNNHEQKNRNTVSFNVGKMSYFDLNYSKLYNLLSLIKLFLVKSILGNIPSKNIFTLFKIVSKSIQKIYKIRKIYSIYFLEVF